MPMENRNAASRMIADYNAMIRYKLQEIDAEECSESICSMNEELKKIKKYEILSQWVPVLQNFIDDLMKMSDDLEQKLNESQSEASDGGNMSQPLVELLQIQEKENDEKNRIIQKMSQGVRSLNEHVTEMQKVHNCGKHAQATALNELGKYLTELEDENDSLFAENEKLKVYLAKIQKEFKAALPSGGNEVPCQGGANGNDLITVLTQENEELKRMIKEFEKKIRHQHSARAMEAKCCQNDAIRIENLEKELANREKTIDELKCTIKNSLPTVRANELEKAIKAEKKETKASLPCCECMENCEKDKRKKTVPDPLLTENERLKALLFKIQKDFKAAVPLGGTEVPCHGGSNALIQENEDLKRMNKELEAKLRHEQNTRQNDVMICQSDRIRIESLEKELANREKIIDELKRTIDNFPPTVRASEMEKAIKAEIKETDAHYMRCKCLEKCEKMKREKTIKMDRGKYATPSDEEEADRKKLKMLEDGTKAMATLLKEKQDILRKLREENKELRESLNINKKLRKTIEELQEGNKQLTGKLKDAEIELRKLIALKENADCSIKVAVEWQTKQKKQDKILQKKINLQTEHITILLQERQNFIEKISSMLLSIVTCRRELAKFDGYDPQIQSKPAIEPPL